MKQQSVLMVLLLLLLPWPILGQSMGTLMITEDTTLTENHQGNIMVGANGVTLDCDGFTVSGTGSGNGIELTSRSGVTVKNCNVEGFRRGFRISDSSNNTFTENVSGNNGRHGFRMANSSNNTFTENISENNDAMGFLLFDNSDNNTFTLNISENNGEFGFGTTGSDNNTFTQNISKNNILRGFSLFRSDNNTFTENTSSGNGDIGFLVEGTSESQNRPAPEERIRGVPGGGKDPLPGG